MINPAVVRDKAANAIKPRQFLARMLHNLKQIYQTKGQPENVLAIIQYLRCCSVQLFRPHVTNLVIDGHC